MARINLIYKASVNRVTGLAQDAMILDQQLRSQAKINHYRITDRRKLRKIGIPSSLRSKLRIAWHLLWGRFDVNVFIEKARPEMFAMARYNILIPNQEMFARCDVNRLKGIDLVLCKTDCAASIFGQLPVVTDMMGFTSPDCLQAEITPDYTQYFHLAGKSAPRRATLEILALWQQNPQFPKLTVVAHYLNTEPYRDCANICVRSDYLSDRELRRLQNEIGIHICLSQTEGFGHFIVEAMSSRALVITTDAMPMNELIQPDRGILVPTERLEPVPEYFHQLAFFNPQILKAQIERVNGLSIAEKQAIGLAARRWYEIQQQSFQAKVVSSISRFLRRGRH
jgi:hypothetical protein